MKLFGLEIRFTRTALYGFGILVLIPLIIVPLLTFITNRADFGLSTLGDGLIVGLGFAAFHEIAQLIHQFGHALMAGLLGYPMLGVRYEYVFSYSEYPDNEPALPDRVHILRSLGGVISLTILLVLTVVIWANIPISGVGFVRWLRNFILFDACLLFFLSAVVSDGVLFIRNQDWKSPNS